MLVAKEILFMRDCERIYFATRALVFSMTSDISSKTSGIPPFRKVTKAASLHMDRRNAFQMPRGEMFLPRPFMQKGNYIDSSYGNYRDEQWALFFPLLSLFFPPRSAWRLTRLDSGEVDMGEGLETRVHRAFVNFSTDLQELREASGTTRPFFRVKFLIPLMHLKANNVYV